MLECIAAALDLVCPRSCFRCRRPLGNDDALCELCRRAFPEPRLAPAPGLDACVAGAAYAGEVEAWVRAFKYPSAFALPEAGPEELLGALLARAAGGWLERAGPGGAPSLVVPVPLHARRLRRRGFNPAGLLARRLARRLGLAFDPVALARTRDTPSQTGLDARDRRRNVAGAFRVARSGGAPERVLLVDDVVTTGATLAAAAHALRRAGASSVVGVTAAATGRRDPPG